MANPCMHYGIPCEVGTEGNCVCRKRFFDWLPTARPMVVGDIYPCHTTIMARGDDLRKIWMWYASQASGSGGT
jgi:hypothetical protein